MVETTIKILSIMILAVVIFSIDYLYLRHLFWQRLAVNIGIVLVYAVLFVTFLN